MLRSDTLHRSLSDPAVTSMGFLTEVAGRYPEAISFALGRPSDVSFEVPALHRYLSRFVSHLIDDLHYGEAGVRDVLFQYGSPKGFIQHLIARNLHVDEGIEVAPESIVVTVGCQEALFLVLRTLSRDRRDAVLAISPTYMGLTGAARLLDMPVLSVDGGVDGVDVAALRERVRSARSEGLRPRALYIIPDFANPAGVTMPTALRHELLEVADAENILLLEDNPYGLFRTTGRRPPTLKALDPEHQVVYLGSMAKTVFPAARVGYIVADQPVFHDRGGNSLLADELAKLKGALTVNTSSMGQAIVAGKLLENDGSLLRSNTAEISLYRRNLERLLKGLDHHFGDVPGVGWKAPDGGFFVVVSMPFPADDTLLEKSAREFGVLWTPMSYFYDGEGGQAQLRLSCSDLTLDDIDEGLRRLAALTTARSQT
ncbi:GntR family transcriptional regulator [Amycolatopsis alba DSM 44262]|uniref:GntR family transcriptional regulator n=1 Tax=Amycolatopsis alba DSM 44262 TaxID=1125972 RepID=A0A229RLC8_AMYAL|nr:GntR family transcriptional regulator [Amycolatopsis alba DSM 44262]